MLHMSDHIKHKQFLNHQHIHQCICIYSLQMIFYHLHYITYINQFTLLNKNSKNNGRLNIISSHYQNVDLNIHIILSLNLFFYVLGLDIVNIHHDFHWNNFHNYDDIINKYLHLKYQKNRYCIHICFHPYDVNH